MACSEKEFEGVPCSTVASSPTVNEMRFSEKQLLYESKNCNSELFCRNWRPRLRRLEFEVNEIKLSNVFLKEHLQACEVQSKDGDQNSSSNIKATGSLSRLRRPSMNTSPAGFSNSPQTTSIVPTCASLSPASTLVDLQKKLIEWTEQYRLLAHKYNEMVRRLQDCHDALHCSSKQTYELEKMNLRLQIHLKEILLVNPSCNEHLSVRKLGVNQAFASPSIGATLQKSHKEGTAEVYVQKVSRPDFIHDGAVPAAACSGSVTCDYQRNMMSMPNIEPLDAILLPSNNYVNPPGFMCTQETSLVSMPSANMKAQIRDMAAPSSQLAHVDGTYIPHFGVSVSESGWNPVLSSFSPTNSVMMDRSTPMKQQSSRQFNIPLSEVASPSDHCRLKNNNPKDTNKNISHVTKVDPSPCTTSPNFGVTSPTACKQAHDEDSPTVINVPKIISIRANSHGRQSTGSNDQRISEEAASDAESINSPTDFNKPHRHRRHSAPIRNEVEKEMKVVALAENMECVAFPQGTYKTEMCNKWVKNMGQYCPYGEKCQFAHGPHELRPVLRHRRYKSILCRMVAAGEVCPYEHRCHFRHVIYPHEATLLSLNHISDSA